MKTKQTLCTALLLCFLVALMPVFAVAAAPTIAVDSQNAKAGGSVDVQIIMQNNPGVVGMVLNVEYSDALTLTAVKDGGILGTSNHTETYSSPYTLTWENDTAKTNFTENGTLATLTFKVADDAADGEYGISVSYGKNGILDKDMNRVDFSVSNGVIKVAHEHIWDSGKVTKAATCKETGVKTLTCMICKETKTETIAKDASNHADYGTEVKNTKAATETAKGYTGDTVCKGCGAVLKKGEDIAPLGHNHTLTKTAAKAATCTAAGNVEYYTCSGCKKTFSDAAGTKEITNVTVPAKGHSFGAWTVEKEATKTEEGLKSRTCTVCGYKEPQKIAKLTEPTSRIILDDGAGKSFVGDKENTTAKVKTEDDKCPATEKANTDTKTTKAAAKNIKTDSGKNTGDNSIIVVMTGLVALAGAAFVVTKKKRS